MNLTTKNDLVTIRALEYLLKNQHGYIDDLNKKSDFDDARIREFCTIGFMKIGWTKKKRTYGVLQFAFDYFKIVR